MLNYSLVLNSGLFYKRGPENMLQKPCTEEVMFKQWIIG